MVSTISFIQANLQDSIAASRLITRTVSVGGIDMALVQELRDSEDLIRGLNIPEYTLYCAGGTDIPRACILARDVNIRVLPGFSCRNVVAVVKCNEDGAERWLVGWLVVPLICHMISEDPSLPLSKEFEELV